MWKSHYLTQPTVNRPVQFLESVTPPVYVMRLSLIGIGWIGKILLVQQDC